MVAAIGILDFALQPYLWAWAERVKSAGYIERFIQLALGDNRGAVHLAYTKKAQVTLPPRK